MKRLLRTFSVISLIMLLCLPNAWAVFNKDMVLTDSTGLWVDSRAYATLSACITAVETVGDPATIVIAESESIDTDNVASYINLKIVGDGEISVSAGNTLTLATRSIDAPRGQIFAGTGGVDFADGTKVDARWFSSLDEAIAETSNDTVTLVISGTMSLSDSAVLGNDVSLLFESPGDNISVANTKTLSNVQYVLAGDWQIFTGLGSVTFNDDDSFRYPIWTGSTAEPTLYDDDRDTGVNVGETVDEDEIHFYIGGTEQLHFEDGAILPETDNDVDLGSVAKQFKEIHGVSGFLGDLELGGGGATVDEFSTDGTMAGDSDTAVPTEKATKKYVDDEIAALGFPSVVAPSLPGLLVRSWFSKKDSDELYLNSAVYYHDGTTEQLLYWDSQLDFTLGPGGSNGDSSAIGLSQWQYIYLDDSAIVGAGTNLVTAAQLLNSIQVPSWSASKHGWYYSSDRCIFAVYIDGSGNITDFYHDGGRLVTFDEPVTSYNASAPANDFSTTVTLRIPSFATRAYTTFRSHSVAAIINPFLVSWRQGDSSGAGHGVISGRFNTSDASYVNTDLNTLAVDTNSSGVIDIKTDSGDTNIDISVYTNGWYLPVGM